MKKSIIAFASVALLFSATLFQSCSKCVTCTRVDNINNVNESNEICGSGSNLESSITTYESAGWECK